MLFRERGNGYPKHRGAGVDAGASLEAERRFLLHRLAAAFEIVRAELRPQHRAELRHLDALDVAGMLGIDSRDLGQVGGPRDDLIQCRIELGIDQWRDVAQHDAGAIVEGIVRQPGCQFRSDLQQVHRATVY